MITNKSAIEKWIKKAQKTSLIGGTCRINKDMSVDVDGDVNLSLTGIKFIPVQFNIVSGNFICLDNPMTTLKGSPRVVGGVFYFNSNKLVRSIKDMPEEIGGDAVIRANIEVLTDCSNKQLEKLYECESGKVKHDKMSVDFSNLLICAIKAKKLSKQLVESKSVDQPIDTDVNLA